MNEIKLEDSNLADLDQLLGAPPIEVTEHEKETVKKPSAATKVMALLSDTEFFHDEYRQPFATIVNNGYKETWSIDSDYFKEWLSMRYWKEHKASLNKNTLNEILATIKGIALFESPQWSIFMRVAAHADSFYIHLANEAHEVVKVTPNGWHIESESPVKFKITSALCALPRPEHGGNIDILWQFVNIPEKYRKLVLVWILESFRTTTHFPILVLSGMQGSAKSTSQNVLRALIDPSVSNLRGAPKKSDDLLINASNNWLVSFNNLSHLSPQQQDDLCCLSTGGGFSTRKLYSNSEEALVEIKRPVILNGISDLVTQQDLMDRCIVVELMPISAKERQTDAELAAQFEHAKPKIFGALLTAFSKALAELPQTHLDEKPRMADFAMLGTALEKALGWPEGSFMAEYQSIRSENITLAMENSSVALAIHQLIEKCKYFSGSYKQLYQELNPYRIETTGWPKSIKGLSNQLKRQAPALELTGISVTFDPKRKADGYHIELKKVMTNHIQQVHNVQETSSNPVRNAERTNKNVHSGLPIQEDVHPAPPCHVRAGKQRELAELVNPKFSNRETFTI